METFYEKFSPNVTRGGIFLASREPQPVGEVFRFEVYLATGGAVLSGEGRVTWVKAFNPAEPTRPHGMGVQFIYIDPETRPVLDELLKRKDPSRVSARPTATVPTVAAPPVVVVPAPAAAPIPVSLPPPVPATKEPARPRVTAADFEELDFGMEESLVRRAVERARALSSRTQDVEALLGSEPEQPVTLEAALADLPRLLGRRNTGVFRTIGDMLPRDTAAAAPKPAPEGNGAGNGENNS